MNFTKIILDGFFDDRNRKYLDKYFYREFERLKPQLYENKEYFEECLSVIQNIEKHFVENEEFENNKTDLVGILWLNSEENSISQIEVYHKDKIKEVIFYNGLKSFKYAIDFDTRFNPSRHCEITYSEIEELTKAIYTAYTKCLNEENQTKELEERIPISKNPQMTEKDSNDLFEILKDFFEQSQQAELKQLLTNGNNLKAKLIFKDNAIRLTDTFKQLIENNLIVGIDKTRLKKWLITNFQYLNNKEVLDLNEGSTHKSISGKNYHCKNPIIMIENGEIRRNTKE